MLVQGKLGIWLEHLFTEVIYAHQALFKTLKGPGAEGPCLPPTHAASCANIIVFVGEGRRERT